ncbi:hypothetical protein ACM614_19060 [Streptomyces sp. 12297]
MTRHEHPAPRPERTYSRRSAVAVTAGAVAWIVCVAVVVARGWGA